MIGIVGVSHKSAPVEIREKLAFEREDALVLARKILQSQYFNEVLVLSTCNRTEVYFVADGICTSGAFKVITQSLLLGDENSKNYLFQYYHREAVRHLFKVVAGLDSMVLGEYQIVSQVKSAFANAMEEKIIGKKFKRLFDKALECGKNVRTRTAMSHGAFSVSYAAVEKCYEEFPDLSDRNILLIGAGDTGELVIKNLSKKGCRNISIVNRTLEKAQELARRYNGRALPFEDMMKGIHDAEIIVTSVATKAPVFDAKRIKPHLNGHERIVMIDLGVPRNIHQDVAEISRVKLLNVDDLEEVVAMNAEHKHEYLSVAEAIVEQKVSEFIEWLNVQNLKPVIANINKIVNQFFDEEMALISDSLTDDERAKYEKVNRHQAKMMRNRLVKNLKYVTDNGRVTEFVGVVNKMFEPSNEK